MDYIRYIYIYKTTIDSFSLQKLHETFIHLLLDYCSIGTLNRGLQMHWVLSFLLNIVCYNVSEIAKLKK